MVLLPIQAQTVLDASMVTVQSLSIPDVKLVRPKLFGDARGWFTEIFSAVTYAGVNLPSLFVQDNVSRSAAVGTIRGLHYQLAPQEQTKLIRVTRGAILDVAVDIRRGSPTFGQHVTVKLDADAVELLLVPAGFAHGFCTLVADTQVEYKVTAPYAPALERGIRWDDPVIGVCWPVTAEMAILSDKDRKLPSLDQAELP